jgi:hypothetical protein
MFIKTAHYYFNRKWIFATPGVLLLAAARPVTHFNDFSDAYQFTPENIAKVSKD